MVCGDGSQAWYFKSKSKGEKTQEVKRAQERLNGLLNTVARFEVPRLNQGQPLLHRVAVNYIDNNAYEVLENPDSDYDMWDCCFDQLLSYGKHNQQYPGIPTDRIKLKILYDDLIDAVYKRTHIDISHCAPRGWPGLPFFHRR